MTGATINAITRRNCLIREIDVYVIPGQAHCGPGAITASSLPNRAESPGAGEDLQVSPEKVRPGVGVVLSEPWTACWGSRGEAPSDPAGDGALRVAGRKWAQPWNKRVERLQSPTAR